MQLNTVSFYGEIERFEEVYIHASHRVWHNGNQGFCCDKSQINHDITQPYMLPHPLHAADGLVLMQSMRLRSLQRSTAISQGCVIGCCFSYSSRCVPVNPMVCKAKRPPVYCYAYKNREYSWNLRRFSVTATILVFYAGLHTCCTHCEASACVTAKVSILHKLEN